MMLQIINPWISFLLCLYLKNLCQEYIPVLAELNEKLTDKNLIKQLRSAQSADEIWQIFECADHSEESEDDTNLDNIEPQEV